DTPSRDSRPLAVPDRQPGLNACGAAVLMPERSLPPAMRLLLRMEIRRLSILRD
ncbi:hypothetical protein IQA48_17175, partial [Leptospira borgpetersenii serovar Ballum]|nr:hypothetical protein [Leptospira borgpetersenii serovar Ballum]